MLTAPSEPATSSTPRTDASSPDTATSGEPSGPYRAFSPEMQNLVRDKLAVIRSSRIGFDRPRRPIPLFPPNNAAPILIPANSPTYLSDLRIEAEALWSYRSRDRGSHLTDRGQKEFKEHLHLTASLAWATDADWFGSVERHVREHAAMLECVGRNAEERFRVWTCWGRGKAWQQAQAKAQQEEREGSAVEVGESVDVPEDGERDSVD